MSKQNKSLQLGMNPSTASGRLIKDLLFKFAVEDREVSCHHCGEEMTREDFTVEHKVPWLDSEDPVGLYFSLENISFSHSGCNSRAARRPNKKHFSRESRLEAKAKAEREKWRGLPVEEQRRIRKEKYLRNGT